MQEITAKVARVRPAARGMNEQDIRHLIHGTGGSPRRAKRAIKLGIAPMLADAYKAALDDGLAHVQAVARCNELWADLVPANEPAEPADAEPSDEAATVH
ncbi:MAG: hypothetical protein HY856_13485 [Burkholderiales bacterium]|nr:hypothetical protein [Burkholderiales bacterium]